jgi:hypothetical protein
MGNCNISASTTYNNENMTQDTVNEDPQSHLTPNVSNPPNKVIVLGDVASEILSESPPKLTEIITLSDPVDIHERIANSVAATQLTASQLLQPRLSLYFSRLHANCIQPQSGFSLASVVNRLKAKMH